MALGGTECQCQTCVTTSSVMSSSSQDVNPQDYQDSPEYSGKQIESGDFRIFSSKRSFLLRKRMMEVSPNHLLLQMESNSFKLSCIRFWNGIVLRILFIFFSFLSTFGINIFPPGNHPKYKKYEPKNPPKKGKMGLRKPKTKCNICYIRISLSPLLSPSPIFCCF